MIIIEGPDNSGKSTLAKHLSTKFNLPIIHSGGPAKSKDEIFLRTVDFFDDHLNLCIRDRFPCISEPIYTMLREGEPHFSGEILAVFLKSLIQYNPLIILCMPPKEKALQGHQMGLFDTPEHYEAVNKNAEALYDSYIKFFMEHEELPFITYDYTQAHQLPDIEIMVLNKIAEMKHNIEGYRISMVELANGN